MPRVRLDNGVELEYETFGEPSAPKGPLMMVMGLGMQLLGWRTEFCEMLAKRGFYVVRYDNRDIGLSSRWVGEPRMVFPRVLCWKLMCCCFPCCMPQTAYTLEDMADDLAGLMTALHIQSAHIMGASMGGMISQIFALNYPQRTRSLCSVFSTTGNPKLPEPSWEIQKMMAKQPAKNATQAQLVADKLLKTKRLSGPKFYDEAEVLQKIEEAEARSTDVTGVARQLCAILTTSDRTSRLKTLRVPTLVCHGDVDPLVPYSHGLATHAAIPDSILYTLEGVGHMLPRVFFPALADQVEANCARAQGASTSSVGGETKALLAGAPVKTYA